jgi:DNA repair exonuclease SbcCD ATPase subunit
VLRLKTLRIRNFRSFRDATITFPESGLLLIRGKNTETGDASGSGKSSILLALAYVLDILPPGFPATELQNWDTEEPLQVTLTLERDGQLIEIVKGKRPSYKDSEKTVTGAKAVNEAVSNLFGYGPEVLRALTYRPQEAGGLFQNLSPAEKVKFLTRVLGLEPLEAAVTSAQEKAKALEVRRTQAEFEYNTYLQQHTAAEAEVVPALEDMAVWQQALVVSQDAYKTAKVRLESARAVLSAEETAAQAAIATQVAEKTEQIRQAQVLLTKLKAEDVVAASGVEAKARELRTRISTLEGAIQKIRLQQPELAQARVRLQSLLTGTCPTCHRTWVEHEAETAATQARIALLEAEVAGLENFSQELTSLRTQLGTCRHTPSPKLEQVLNIERAMSREWLESVLSPTAQHWRKPGRKRPPPMEQKPSPEVQ